MPVIAEEEVAAGRIPAHGGTFFLVDPLDGTKEFVRGGDDYTVNIALVVDKAPRLGVVFAPATGRLHGGIAGRHAWLDEGQGRQAISCRACAQPPIVVASKSHFTQNTADYLALAAPGCGYEAVGSSLKFCIVAEGRADLYPRLGPTAEWDTAAGHAVLLGAGGRVDGPDGEPLALRQAGVPQPRLRRHRRLGRAARAGRSCRISPAAANCRRGSSLPGCQRRQLHPVWMKVRAGVRRCAALQPFDLAPQGHDLAPAGRPAPNRGAGRAKRQQAGQPLRFGKRDGGLGEPLVLVCIAWTHRQTRPPSRAERILA